jgi:RluA family pseudouridine synthase
VNAPLETLFEDEHVLVVNKPVGLVVDNGAERSDTNPDLILRMKEAGKVVFPYHRLDRDTSGIVLLGKSKKFAREISALFEEKRIRKAYLAAVSGEWPKALNKVSDAIGERESFTTFRVLAASAEKSLIEALPKTGRKHQIRIHCANSKHPVLGDELYGKTKAESYASANGHIPAGHALHAYSLSFRHPATGETVTYKAPPKEWEQTWLAGLSYQAAWTRLFAEERQD